MPRSTIDAENLEIFSPTAFLALSMYDSGLQPPIIDLYYICIIFKVSKGLLLTIPSPVT